jgi:pimeloyl-ACP methyl ester carboxylesterase
VNPVRHVIYLHGFTSSPASSKAQRFGRELAARGVTFACPDFNHPSFHTLTITRMLEQTAEAIARAPAGPVALVGSSLGAFVAVHAVAGGRANDDRRSPTTGASLGRDTSGPDDEWQPPTTRGSAVVDRLILLAPALDFGRNRLAELAGRGVEEWRRAGRITLFHHAANAPQEIGFALYEDAAQYDALAVDVRLPTLVFQGRRDELVAPDGVERWARGRPAVDLRLVDDGHQLTSSMDLIWAESAKLLGLSESREAPAWSGPRA